MSLVKKNRIDHFKKNKKNKGDRAKKQQAQLRRLSADKKALSKA